LWKPAKLAGAILLAASAVGGLGPLGVCLALAGAAGRAAGVFPPLSLRP
jgi:hypothetical protein